MKTSFDRSTENWRSPATGEASNTVEMRPVVEHLRRHRHPNPATAGRRESISCTETRPTTSNHYNCFIGAD
jgi:hypothetical protein